MNNKQSIIFLFTSSFLGLYIYVKINFNFYYKLYYYIIGYDL